MPAALNLPACFGVFTVYSVRVAPRQLATSRRLAPWHLGCFFYVRPAWAHTCGCKSRHELVTVSEVKRNCMKVTECGKEARSINREPMNKNRIEGAAKQGKRA